MTYIINRDVFDCHAYRIDADDMREYGMGDDDDTYAAFCRLYHRLPLAFQNIMESPRVGLTVDLKRGLNNAVFRFNDHTIAAMRIIADIMMNCGPAMCDSFDDTDRGANHEFATQIIAFADVCTIIAVIGGEPLYFSEPDGG